MIFRIIDKNEASEKAIMDVLHQYPDHFVHGLFEKMAHADFLCSDTMIAESDGKILACLMFHREKNEFNWLAVSKDVPSPRSAIAKQLFEELFKTIPAGTLVHFYVNTEDAYIPGNQTFSGKNFDPARKLYRAMGLNLPPKNIIRNYYGVGSHVYKVEWEIKK